MLDPSINSVEETLSIKEDIREQLHKIKHIVETENIKSEEEILSLFIKYLGGYTKSTIYDKYYTYQGIKYLLDNPDDYDITDAYFSFCKYYVCTFNVARSVRLAYASEKVNDKIIHRPEVLLTINYLQLRREHRITITKEKLFNRLIDADKSLKENRFLPNGVLNTKAIELQLKITDKMYELLGNIENGDSIAKERINLTIKRKEEDLDKPKFDTIFEETESDKQTDNEDGY